MARSAKLASLMAALALGGSGSVLSDDLAKASQNPVGDIISLPIELWHYGDMPGDSDATLLIAKPVYPVNIGKVNLVNRLIVPYVWVDANLSQLDLGDFEVPRRMSTGTDSQISSIRASSRPPSPPSPARSSGAWGLFWRCPPIPMIWAPTSGPPGRPRSS
jgi:hypothetical protein